MEYLRFLILVLLISASTQTTSFAQDNPFDFEKAYGLDPVLYNGRIYSYFVPPGTEGTQFFTGQDFLSGTAKIRGILFKDLLLNYDVYNQQLILEYYPEDGVRKLIVVSDAWLEEFNLGKMHFELLAISGTEKRIYQVIENDTYRILYSWRKDLLLNNKHGATNHVFSDPSKESYLRVKNQFVKFGNNKSFIALFDPDDRATLKKYMHQRKINLKKASDELIMELIEYCKASGLR